MAQLQVLHDPELIRIVAEGDSFSLQDIQKMREQAEAIAAEDNALPVAICTAGLDIVGSSCLSGIVNIVFTLRKSGHQLFVVDAREEVLSSFEETSLLTFLSIYDTVEDGLADLHRQS